MLKNPSIFEEEAVHAMIIGGCFGWSVQWVGVDG